MPVVGVLGVVPGVPFIPLVALVPGVAEPGVAAGDDPDPEPGVKVLVEKLPELPELSRSQL
jgi:hypothetical protein